MRKRRRRRRRRGRGGAAGDAVATDESGAPVPRPPVPDRHIFRVDGTGSAEPTGETAPPEPGRAIARVDRKAGHVAIEPPPKSLSVPEVPAKVAKPTRRGRKADDVEPTQLALGSTAPIAEPAATEAPRRRGRPRKVAIDPSAPAASATAEPVPEAVPVAAAAEPEKPKRGRPRKVAALVEPIAEAVPEPAAPVRRTAVSRTTAAKKSTAKAPARKAAAAPAARKTAAPAARKKTPAAAATSTRKKTR